MEAVMKLYGREVGEVRELKWSEDWFGKIWELTLERLKIIVSANSAELRYSYFKSWWIGAELEVTTQMELMTRFLRPAGVSSREAWESRRSFPGKRWESAVPVSYCRASYIILNFLFQKAGGLIILFLCPYAVGKLPMKLSNFQRLFL